jgi:hypothetical protein
MPVAQTSPNVSNYRLGKGILYVKRSGETVYRDIGEVADFTVSVASSQLQHKSTREGVGVVDFTLLTETSSTLKFSMEEVTPENWALMFLGTPVTLTNGDIIIDVLSNANTTVDVKFESTNENGPSINYEANVTITPTGDVAMVTNADTLTSLPITAGVNKDAITGAFGRFTYPAPAP